MASQQAGNDVPTQRRSHKGQAEIFRTDRKEDASNEGHQHPDSAEAESSDDDEFLANQRRRRVPRQPATTTSSSPTSRNKRPIAEPSKRNLQMRAHNVPANSFNRSSTPASTTSCFSHKTLLSKQPSTRCYQYVNACVDSTTQFATLISTTRFFHKYPPSKRLQRGLEPQAPALMRMLP